MALLALLFSPCPLQIEALGNLVSEVESLVDDLKTVLVAADWEALMKPTAVAYTGEEVFPVEDWITRASTTRS